MPRAAESHDLTVPPGVALQYRALPLNLDSGANRSNTHMEITMRKLALSIALLTSSLMTAHIASAANAHPTDAELKACFEAHARLMEKPAGRNWIACWRAHGYLMKSS